MRPGLSYSAHHYKDRWMDGWISGKVIWKKGWERKQNGNRNVGDFFFFYSFCVFHLSCNNIWLLSALKVLVKR
jgi:hypothetical protein